MMAPGPTPQDDMDQRAVNIAHNAAMLSTIYNRALDPELLAIAEKWTWEELVEIICAAIGSKESGPDGQS